MSVKEWARDREGEPGRERWGRETEREIERVREREREGQLNREREREREGVTERGGESARERDSERA